MATPLQNYAQLIAYIDSLIFNPSRNFLKDADYQNWIQMAALETALEVGGLRYIDSTLVTIAGQRDYIINGQYKRIDQAQYITGIDTSSETIYPMEVVTAKDVDLLKRLASPSTDNVYDTDAPFLFDSPQPQSKFVCLWPEIQTIRLYDAPAVAGDTIKLWLLGIPQALLPGVTYDGDSMDIPAIAYKVCDLARMKSRETQEASGWDIKWQAACDRIRKFRSKMRRVRQIQDGRFFVSRLRSVNGGK